MDNFTRLLTEMICHKHGIHDPKIEDNLAIDSDGELIQEVKIFYKPNITAECIEISVTLGKASDFDPPLT